MNAIYYSLRPFLIAALAGLLSIAPARAADEGQADLDAATEKKLTAENLNDLGEVIELCEAAMKKGLEPANADFAKSLLTSSLLQRAGFITKAIVERTPREWPRMRLLALSDLQKAVELDAKLGTAHLMIARLQSLPGGDRAAAMKAAEQATELAKGDPGAQVEALVLRANLTDDAEKKLALYNEAIEQAPNNDEALRYRGLFLLLQGKLEPALADLDAAAKSDPENADTQEARGLALFMLKRNDDAIAAFTEASKLAPDSPLPLLHRARVHAAAKDTKAALADLDAGLKLDPDNTGALLLRARVHQQAGDKDAARADVDTALKDRPGLAPALEMRAILSAGAGDFRQAVADFEELLKIAPKNTELLSQTALLYAANKQPRKAIEKYTAALAENPELFNALRGRADASLNIGKHAEAVTDYEAAMKLRQDDTGVLNNLAWVLATSPDDAVRDAKRSIAVGTKACQVTDYKEAHILSTLAAGYAEAGEWDKAVEWSKKAVELGSDEPDTAEQLKKELASYEMKKPWREKQEMEEKDADAK